MGILKNLFKGFVVAAKQKCLKTYTGIKDWAQSMTVMKITALIVVNCFLLTAVYGQAVAGVMENQRATEQFKQVFEDFDLPYSYGKITEADYQGSDTVVINIQDLHNHSGVQKNISNIISTFDNKYGVKNIYLEGAYGDVSTKWLTAAKDENIREKVINGLLNNGRLTGAEYFSATTGKTEIIKGLENKEKYFDNLKRFGNIIENQPIVSLRINAIKETVKKLQDKYYGKQQKKIEELSQKYAEGKVEPKKYFTLMKKHAEKLSVDIENYPNLSLYVKMLEEGKKIDYQKTTQQLQVLVLKLKQVLPFAVYKKLMDNTNNFSQMDKFYGYIIKLSRDYNLDLAQNFPELEKFFSYIELSQKINPLELVEEEQNFKDEINLRFAVNRTQEEIVFLSNFVKYYQDYLLGKISTSDCKYYTENIDRFKYVWVKYIDNREVVALKKYEEIADTFYKINFARNEYFMESMKSAFKGKKLEKEVEGQDTLQKAMNSLKSAKNVYITITGGFHTQELAKMLSEKGITNVVITPNVSGDIKVAQETYYNLVKEQSKISFQTIPALAVGNYTSEQIINLFANLDEISENELKQLIKDVLDVLKEKNWRNKYDVKVEYEDGKLVSITVNDKTYDRSRNKTESSSEKTEAIVAEEGNIISAQAAQSDQTDEEITTNVKKSLIDMGIEGVDELKLVLNSAGRKLWYTEEDGKVCINLSKYVDNGSLKYTRFAKAMAYSIAKGALQYKNGHKVLALFSFVLNLIDCIIFGVPKVEMVDEIKDKIEAGIQVADQAKIDIEADASVDIFDDARLNALIEKIVAVKGSQWSEVGKAIFRRTMEKYIYRVRAEANGIPTDKLSIKDDTNPTGNFTPLAFLKTMPKFVSQLGSILKNSKYLEKAKDTIVEYCLMNGGKGSSVVRDGIIAAVREFNKELAAYQQKPEGEAKQAEFKRLQEELKTLAFLEKVSGTEKVEIGAKADDLYFVVTNEAGEQELKSITEIKLGKILDDKASGMYKDVSLVMLVSPESEPLVQGLYYARPELGTELSAAMEKQEMYPVVQLKDGKINFLLDKSAPGGHGVWPTTLLSRIFNKTIKGIMFVGNSDAIASSSIPEVVGWMKAEKVGIAMLSVDREPIDRKGGIFGLLKVYVKDKSGKFIKTIEVPTILELAQAEEAKQAGLFEEIGLEKGEAQPFNTNSLFINEEVMAQLRHGFMRIYGISEEEATAMINNMMAPDLIRNQKSKNGVDWEQPEGAMASSVLNLNRNLEVLRLRNAKVNDLLNKILGEGNQLVRIVNADKSLRDTIFTPVKFSTDLWIQFVNGIISKGAWKSKSAEGHGAVNVKAPSDYKVVEEKNGRRELVTKDAMYKDVYQLLRYWRNCDIRELSNLYVNNIDVDKETGEPIFEEDEKIITDYIYNEETGENDKPVQIIRNNGIVRMSGVVLKGDVTIQNRTDKELLIRADMLSACDFETDANGNIILENVTILAYEKNDGQIIMKVIKKDEEPVYYNTDMKKVREFGEERKYIHPIKAAEQAGQLTSKNGLVKKIVAVLLAITSIYAGYGGFRASAAPLTETAVAAAVSNPILQFISSIHPLAWVGLVIGVVVIVAIKNRSFSYSAAPAEVAPQTKEQTPEQIKEMAEAFDGEKIINVNRNRQDENVNDWFAKREVFKVDFNQTGGLTFSYPDDTTIFLPTTKITKITRDGDNFTVTTQNSIYTFELAEPVTLTQEEIEVAEAFNGQLVTKLYFYEEEAKEYIKWHDKETEVFEVTFKGGDLFFRLHSTEENDIIPKRQKITNIEIDKEGCFVVKTEEGKIKFALLGLTLVSVDDRSQSDKNLLETSKITNIERKGNKFTVKTADGRKYSFTLAEQPKNGIIAESQKSQTPAEVAPARLTPKLREPEKRIVSLLATLGILGLGSPKAKAAGLTAEKAVATGMEYTPKNSSSLLVGIYSFVSLVLGVIFYLLGKKIMDNAIKGKASAVNNGEKKADFGYSYDIKYWLGYGIKALGKLISLISGAILFNAAFVIPFFDPYYNQGYPSASAGAAHLASPLAALPVLNNLVSLSAPFLNFVSNSIITKGLFTAIAGAFPSIALPQILIFLGITGVIVAITAFAKSEKPIAVRIKNRIKNKLESYSYEKQQQFLQIFVLVVSVPIIVLAIVNPFSIIYLAIVVPAIFVIGEGVKGNKQVLEKIQPVEKRFDEALKNINNSAKKSDENSGTSIPIQVGNPGSENGIKFNLQCVSENGIPSFNIYLNEISKNKYNSDSKKQPLLKSLAKLVFLEKMLDGDEEFLSDLGIYIDEQQQRAFNRYVKSEIRKLKGQIRRQIKGDADNRALYQQTLNFIETIDPDTVMSCRRFEWKMGKKVTMQDIQSAKNAGATAICTDYADATTNTLQDIRKEGLDSVVRIPFGDLKNNIKADYNNFAAFAEKVAGFRLVVSANDMVEAYDYITTKQHSGIFGGKSVSFEITDINSGNIGAVIDFMNEHREIDLALNSDILSKLPEIDNVIEGLKNLNSARIVIEDANTSMGKEMFDKLTEAIEGAAISSNSIKRIKAAISKLKGSKNPIMLGRNAYVSEGYQGDDHIEKGFSVFGMFKNGALEELKEDVIDILTGKDDSITYQTLKENGILIDKDADELEGENSEYIRKYLIGLLSMYIEKTLILQDGSVIFGQEDKNLFVTAALTMLVNSKSISEIVAAMKEFEKELRENDDGLTIQQMLAERVNVLNTLKNMWNEKKFDVISKEAIEQIGEIMQLLMDESKNIGNISGIMEGNKYLEGIKASLSAA